MIAFERAAGRVPPIAIAPIDARLEAGVHALLGGRDDGVAIVLAMVAGAVKVRGGAVRVLDARAGEAGARRDVAHVPLDVAVPEPLRVDEMLALAASLRGEPARDAKERLTPFGLASLARAKLGALSLEEKRAVALAEALTSRARVLLLDEPLASIDPRAARAIAESLRARADDGACVVFATASVRDARSLADDVLAFDRGRLARHAPSSDPLVLAGPNGAALHVVASDPKALAAALAREEHVASLHLEPRAVVARGRDPLDLARAVARAARDAGVTIESLRPALVGAEDLRGAIAADTQATYRAAYDRARAAMGGT